MKKSNSILSLFFCSVLLLSVYPNANAMQKGRWPQPPPQGAGRFIDITHTISADLPAWDSQTGTGSDYIWLVSSIKNGNASNNSEFKLSTHTGTHVDAPSHFYQEYYEQGFDITTVPLTTLTGPVLVVEVPWHSNITADVLMSLGIPDWVERVLFRTSNTHKKLMHQKEFDSSFTGFVADGATWLVENTNVKLVGIDYLSIAAYTDGVPVHKTLLRDRRVVPVEGLNLDHVREGLYNLICLPLKLSQADGCPARCLLSHHPFYPFVPSQEAAAEPELRRYGEGSD